MQSSEHSRRGGFSTPIQAQGVHNPDHDYLVVQDAVVRNPQLHSILSLCLTLYQPPSALQIAHLLEIPSETVLRSLLPLSLLLNPPGPPAHSSSAIRLSDRMREVLMDPAKSATYVHPPRWHAFVAVWCLTRSDIKQDARDILYAAEFWAQHLCEARPSEGLWDALRRSRLPCRIGSHAMLPWVVTWLGKVDTEDTRELIMLYRATYRRTEDAVNAGMRMEIMGGAMSMQIQS
ncbi:hypothetical protein C8R46DRAFT_113418 [Mycena filopes]|nr:hypothetical protein C8R46DRAFT_113418 [Mycena filopes]